jgi:SAM-dependent methyltransferase
MTGRAVLSSLAPGEDADVAFDGVYPDWVRRHSRRHWTPTEVAQRAAELLVTDDSTRVLDVGSGAGKFCIIGALTTRGVFSGIEQRPALVEVARAAANHYGARRTNFIHGDITSIDWREFNAFYLFNPFSEDGGSAFEAIDQTIAFSPAQRERYIRFTRVRLEGAPAGTRVATYHGYGGPMPTGFRRIRCEPKGSDFVELWVKEPTVLWVPPSSRAGQTSTLASGAWAA